MTTSFHVASAINHVAETCHVSLTNETADTCRMLQATSMKHATWKMLNETGGRS